MRATTPEDAHSAILRFIEASREPALLEPGEEQIALGPGSYHVELRNGRLTLQAWDRTRNLSRRVTGVLEDKPGRLALAIEKFGGQQGIVQLIDAARPQNLGAVRRGARLTWRERFRRSVLRQFPGWSIHEISSEPDLEHSLSPAYPRAFLKKNRAGWAAISCGPENPEPDGVLSFGLVWLEYLRKREPRTMIEGLALFLPAGRERNTCLRLLYLNRSATHFRVFACEDALEVDADLADYGNVDTRLVACSGRIEDPWTASLNALPGVETIELNTGGSSFRVRGLEFARLEDGRLSFGLERRHTAALEHLEEIRRLALGIARLRHPRADRAGRLYLRDPELWLESQVRASLPELDAALRPAPVYGQVPAFAGRDRGIIDLLTADLSGRLAILELKASEDIHLPLQALDYWIRVKWHLDRDEFAGAGYFPGLELRRAAPRILLVAPALQFHPTTDAMLRHFDPAIELERIGVGMDWRSELRVAFRWQGAEGPRFATEPGPAIAGAEAVRHAEASSAEGTHVRGQSA